MNNEEKQAFDQLKRDVEDLKQYKNNQHIEIDTDFYGLLQSVSVDPSTLPLVPKSLYDQVQIYKSGATLRLYVYDGGNQAWRFATLT